jgi:sigma-B regulation protein RsbU (phosphoserine phosphatase)
MPEKNKDSEKKPTDISDEKLNALFELTKSINLNASIDQLLDIYREILEEKLSIGRLMLLSYDSTWRCILSYGIDQDSLEFAFERAKGYSHLKEIAQVHKDSWPEGFDLDIVVPVNHKDDALAYVFLGDLREGKHGAGSALKHLPYIQTLSNILVVAIENKKLAKENIHQVLLKHELDLAKEIQSILVPSVLPHTDELDVAAYYLPFHQISGDYYDFIPLNESEFAFCIADVSGKGVAAALLMSNFQASLHAQIEQTNSLTELVIRLNKNVMDTARGESFITFFIAKFNRLTQTLHYVNAGHYPPILFMENTVNLLKSGGPALGMLPEIPYLKEGIIAINPTASFLAYTDGITELENDKQEEFSIEKLRDLFISLTNAGLTAKQINDKIAITLSEYKGRKKYLDDITLLCLRVLKRSQLPLFNQG